MVTGRDVNQVPEAEGGASGTGAFSYKCSDQFSSNGGPNENLIPRDCVGGSPDWPRAVLEMNVKFPVCWNRQDPADPGNFRIPRTGSWYTADCEGDATLPHLEYFVNYPLDPGESTDGWFLSSDVDPATFTRSRPGGSSHHADWWGGWHPEINRTWIDNCVHLELAEPSDCGFGYLTNGGPDGDDPLPGPALKYRPQYEGPNTFSAETVFDELCVTDRQFRTATDAAYCNPAGTGDAAGGAPSTEHAHADGD